MKSPSMLLVLLFGFMTAFSQDMGTISFSKTPLANGKGGTETSFQAGDAIFATATFTKPIKDYFTNGPAGKKIEATIIIYELKAPLYAYQDPSEEQLTFAAMFISGEAMNQNYLTFELAPVADKCKDYANPDFYFKEFGKKYDGAVNYTENLGKLSGGKHDLRILVRILDVDASSGKFTINGNDYNYYSKQSELLNQVARSVGAKTATMPKSLKMDNGLEARMITALKNSNDWKSARINAPELLKLNIIDSDWYIRRNELTGVILHRYIRAAVAVKNKSGECGYYPLVSFQEDYVGGKFQPLHYDGIGDFVVMDCANVTK